MKLVFGRFKLGLKFIKFGHRIYFLHVYVDSKLTASFALISFCEEGGMTRKEGGLVLSVRGGRMEVLINQERRSLNLAQIWKENYLPVKGMVI